MTRVIGFLCCAVILAGRPTYATAAQALNPESTVTVTATIEAVDKENRIVRLKRKGADPVDVKAPADMHGFSSLRAGDQVTATYFAAYAVEVRKPGDTTPPAAPVTTPATRWTSGSSSRCWSR